MLVESFLFVVVVVVILNLINVMLSSCMAGKKKGHDIARSSKREKDQCHQLYMHDDDDALT